MLNRIRAYFIRQIFSEFIVELKPYPIVKGKLFQRISIAGVWYYHVSDYKCLKSKNQKEV